MKHKYEIIYGTGLDKNKEFIKDINIDSILRIIAQDLGGYSLNAQHGGYMMANGQLAQETRQTITILTNKPLDGLIDTYALAIKVMLNQESVLVVKTKIQGRFI